MHSTWTAGVRRVITLMGLVFLAMPGAYAGRILIDFGVPAHETKGLDAAGRFWNAASLPSSAGATAPDFTPLDLKDDKGGNSGFTLKVTDPFLGAFDLGDNPQELYPASVGKDRWSLEKGKKETATMEITGLNPANTYDFHFFGVRDAPIAFVTRYDVNGKQVSVAAQNNRSTLGTVTGVVPNPDGTVKIGVSIAEGPNAHMSALEITWGGELPTRPGQFASFYHKPTPASVVATPAPKPASVVATPVPTKPNPPSKPAAKPAATPAPLLTKSQTQPEKSKVPLFIGIALLLVGLGVGGFSGYKLGKG